MEDHDLIILDEITNALDKKTVNEIYEFINDFIQSHQTKTIINITHNLSDLSALPGKYFIFKDLQIEESSPDSCVKCYTMFYHFYLSKLMYFLEE